VNDHTIFIVVVTFGQSNEVNILSSTPVLRGGESLRLEWIPKLFSPESEEVYSTILVDIQLYRYERRLAQWQEMSELATRVLNTGNGSVIIPATIAVLDPQLVVIKVSPNPRQEQVITDYNISEWSSLAYTESEASTLEKLCRIWDASEPVDFGNTLLEHLLPCPPNIQIARIDLQYRVDDNAINYLEFFHPNSFQCFHQASVMR